ncbi:MAG: hypothetical protein D6740_02405, partial [Alphaproteobacteria bacterium]
MGARRVFSWRALAMTISMVVLTTVSMLLIIDGFEWALLRLMGVPEWPTEIVMGVTAVPVLFVVWRFGRKVWTIETELPEA